MPQVELLSAQLPGRGSRFAEPLVTDVRRLAREAASEVDCEGPFTFFGHSFGALVAYEVCLALRDAQRPMPSHLWVSAFPAPDRIPQNERLTDLPARALLELLAERFGAIPSEVLANDELAHLVAQYVHADYEAIESYVPRPAAPLNTGLVVLTARDDHRPEEEAPGWRRFTTGAMTHRVFDGGHFYLHEAANRAVICAELLRALGATHMTPSGGDLGSGR